MIAAKMMDMVMGVDIHIVQPPGPVPPIPFPHPFIGMVMDPMEFLPFIGASTWVNGMPRAQAGNEAKGVPPHIPLGGTFIKPVDSEGEIFMGSATVVVEDEPFSRMSSPVLSCSCIGMPSPPRPKGKAKAGLKLPTSVLIAIPGGQLVMVGGPPTISMMAIGMKLGMAAGGKFFNRFVKNSGAYKKLCAKIHDAASLVTRHLPENLRNKIHRNICSVIGHPVDVGTGKVFTDRVDFELPGPIPLVWERIWYSTSGHAGALGHGWHHNYDLELSREEETLELRLPDGRNAFVDYFFPGEEMYLRQEKLRFTRDDTHFIVTDEHYTAHYFRIDDLTVNASAKLDCILRPGAPKITFAYDGRGCLREIVDSAGRRLTVLTDARGRITAIEAPHPQPGDNGAKVTLVRYRYDAAGDLVESTDAVGGSFRYTYRDHLLTRETNRNELSFYFEYTGKGQEACCVHTWGDGGIHDNTVTYDTENRVTRVVNSLGQVTLYHYNEDGLVWKTVDPLGHERLSLYGEACELLREVDELGRVTSYVYDALGHRSEITYPDGSRIKLTRKDHLLAAAKDQVGGSWSWVYDELHRLVARTDPTGATTAYGYSGPNLTAIVDPAGNRTVLAYDKEYNLTRLSTADGASSEWRYDRLGRVTAATDARGNVRNRKLNLLGNTLKVREPDGNVRVLDYDGEENIVRAKDRQYDVAFEYVGMNRLAARIEAGTRVAFRYNTEEELVAIENEHGSVYTFGLDDCGRVVRESGFDRLTRTYVRDAAGQVVRVRRPGDRETDYAYDRVGRVTEVNHWDGSAERYTYRADGELTAAVNGAIRVSFERDRVGRVLTERQGGFVVTSKYDKLGNRVGLTSSLGADVAIRRNKMGDVEEVISQTGKADPWAVQFERDMLGLELERSLPGGVRSRWQRDRLGRPAKQITTVGGERERSRTYQWGVNDRLQSIVDSAKGRFEFEHDVFGNLAAATYPDGSRELRMPDAVGNLFKTGNRGDRKYGPAGQLLEADGTTFRYDPEGNLISKTRSNGERWAYEWNAAGMLARVVRPDGRVVTFTYDALGRRIAKRYGRHLTRWVWDGNVMLHEWREEAPPTPIATRQQDPGGEDRGKRITIRRRDEQLRTSPGQAPPSANGNGHAKPVAVDEPAETITAVAGDLTTWLFEPESFSPLAKLTPTQDYGIVTDHLGTPLSMYSQAGTKSWELELSIYGDTRTLDGWRGECPFRYPGQYEDVETGLYYNRFRYFDPEVGGYVSQDPIRLASNTFNLIAYVPDTNSWTDVFGLSFGSGKGQHSASVTVFDQSDNILHQEDLVSGNMTPEEKALGFPQSTLATHTENRAVRNIPLEPGHRMEIIGQYPPCNSCQGAMRRASSGGRTVEYLWVEDGIPRRMTYEDGKKIKSKCH
ncbi:RHS repeat-associated protein [Neolewinella xylanilytica]|uniref:RHS repeat-associated protein n=1 Tax=Neolewinella xylanilytica TaxID=1514080 RepID=A0A2S6IB86_9BACT|nr:DUF6531 domain-containing protein [Neolewinella xylanilytica]PPK88770.1 RHS repeat-associated protein [Neolewinella xylanilytica]